MFKFAAVSIMGLSAALLGGSALAVPVTLVGPNVSFTYDDALLGLFGTPTLAGDSLVFTPTDFFVESSNGVDGLVVTNETLNIRIAANPGYQFSSVSLTERGDYYLIGSDAEVAVGGQIRVIDLDDPLNNEVTSNIAASAPLDVHTTLGGFTTTNWTATASVVVPGAAAGWGGADGNVDSINLTIENLLLARTTAAGSSAFIEKKFSGSSMIVSAIPEAETWAMLLAGLGLVGFMVRRRAGIDRHCREQE
jgi:hypothetical protein